MMRLASWVVLLLAAFAIPAGAHPMAPALLEIRELRGGSASVVWKTPRLLPSATPLEPVLPSVCATIGEPTTETKADALIERWRTDCGVSGFTGLTLRARGLGENATNAIVRLAFADGRSIRALLSERAPSFVVPDRESKLAVWSDYVRLGIGHLTFGLDHLLFVLGLFLLVEGRKPLIAAVTAFTAGHSVTLSLATLGVVRFPQRWAEVGIAASIVLLAAELENRRSGSYSRWAKRPWTIAFVFGLLHGLGFAAALAEVGLPQGEIPLALFGFNLGIELAQLGFVATLLAAGLAARRIRIAAPGRFAAAPAYAIGTLAAFWCFDRIAAIVGV